MANLDAYIKPLKTKRWLALLVTLFVMVLIAHLAIITSARGQFSIIKSAQTEAFTTRRIELPELPLVQKELKKQPNLVEIAKPEKVKRPYPLPASPTTPSEAIAESQVVASPVESATESQTLVSAPVQAFPIPEPIETKPSPSDVPAKSVAPDYTPKDSMADLSPMILPSVTPNADNDAGVNSDALTTATMQPPAFAIPSPAKHLYKVLVNQKGNSFHGKAEFQLLHDANKYSMSLTASQLLYSITWQSKGDLAPQGFLPERFSDKRSFKGEVAAHFRRDLAKITFSSNTPEAVLQNAAQDRVSVIWQIAGMLAAEPARYLPGTSFAIQTADATEAQTWVFTVNASESLLLENGSVQTIRVTRNPRREFDRKIDLWFAPTMAYLPVRLKHTHTNGDFDDFLWLSSQPIAKVQ